MNLKVLNIDGNKSKDINVSDKLTGLKVNNRLLKYVIDWQLNHSKKRVAKTKQRNEVVGSTKKIYAQKRLHACSPAVRTSLGQVSRDAGRYAEF